MGTIKVFEMNDCEWVAAATLESAKEFYLAEFSGGESEEECCGGAAELSDEAMDSLIFSDEDGGKSSFREQLDHLIGERVKFPCLFASTEY